MKVADLMNGSNWIIWVTITILFILSIVLISGYGSGLIAGFNTLPKETQIKYDEKKLCKTVGIGILIIAVLLFVIALFQYVLPSIFAYISLVIMIVDSIVVIFLMNTICRKNSH